MDTRKVLINKIKGWEDMKAAGGHEVDKEDPKISVNMLVDESAGAATAAILEDETDENFHKSHHN